MSEEPNAVIDCYLAISLDSLVFICEHSKVYVFNDIPLYLLYLISICISSVRTLLFYQSIFETYTNKLYNRLVIDIICNSVIL